MCLYKLYRQFDTVSYCYTIVVHNRDNQEVGVAHEVKSPENQPQITIGQYWLGKTKPKQAQNF